MHVRVALIGFGRVGRAFAQLAASELRRQRGILVDVVGIVRSGGLICDIETGEESWEESTTSDALKAWRPTVVVQAIPSSLDAADAAYSQTIAALDCGAHVVTATKSALAARWDDLELAAQSSARALRFSAALGAGLPITDFIRHGLKGATCTGVRASLNGTSNFVIERMKDGAPLENAIATARSLGMAEGDVSGDLDGTDAAAKLVLLSHLLWGIDLRIEDVHRDAIDSSIEAMMSRGEAIRSVATGDPRRGLFAISVGAIGPDDPLYALVGARKAAYFETDELGVVGLAGGASSPGAAGAALLRDVLNIAAGDDAPGLR